jgi:hypothetical protein
MRKINKPTLVNSTPPWNKSKYNPENAPKVTINTSPMATFPPPLPKQMQQPIQQKSKGCGCNKSK